MTVQKRIFLTAYKCFFAAAAIGAIVNEIAVLAARGTFAAQNFFSFFTIQSNIIAAAALVFGAYAVLTRSESPRIDALRGAATLYIALTGVVFSLLLAGLDPKLLTAIPIDNTILHYVIPAAVVLDWLLDRPRAVIAVRVVFIWLLYPLAYLAYSLIRGPIAGWYPYPFLDPAVAGYAPVVVTCACITAGTVVAGFIVRAWSLRPAAARARSRNLV